MNLAEMEEKKVGRIVRIEGSHQFQKRITSIGLIPEGRIECVQNDGSTPVLLFSRDTFLAVNRTDCNNIIIEML